MPDSNAPCPTCDAAKRADVIASVIQAAGSKRVAVRERRAICKSCPHAQLGHLELLSWATFSTCKLCECNIAFKTRQAAAQCPDQPPRW